MVLTSLSNNAELQPHCPEGFAGRREANADHRFLSKSDYTVSTSQLDDCVFFNAD